LVQACAIQNVSVPKKTDLHYLPSPHYFEFLLL
jgi:hypothetical protein